MNNETPKKGQRTLLETLDLSDQANIIEMKLHALDLIESIKQKADPDAMVLYGFDSCIIGLDNDGRIVYDKDLMVTQLVQKDGMESIDAEEYLQFNVFCLRTDDTLPPVFVSLNHELLITTYV